MTAKSFRRRLVLTLALLTSAILLTIALAWALEPADPDAKDPGGYVLALVPLYIVFAAAWLSSLFQRRIAYTNALREYWKSVVGSIQDARQYTFLTAPKPEDFAAVMRGLSCRIDELRSVFRNVGEVYAEPTEDMKLFVKGVKHGGTIDDYRALIIQYDERVRRTSGLYPYESLKQIQTAIGRLGHGADFTPRNAAVVRTIIDRLWGILRAELLKELERDYPEFPDTPYDLNA